MVLLLTDGTVLAQSSTDLHVWTRLTPDATGSYVNGTWSPGASTQIGRHFFPLAVTRDGRAFVAGGEDLSPGESDHNAAEVYDPILNTWFRAADSPLGDIGDVGNQVLTDGRIFLGDRFGPQTQVFDPATFQWTVTATKPFGSSTQATWSLLPSGAVLDFTQTPPLKYLPSSNVWITDATPPAPLLDPSDTEIGPGIFLYDGRLLAVGGLGNTALYTPGPTPAANGTWVAGPNMPPPTVPNGNPNGTQFSEDVPGCIEPNGKVLIISSDQNVNNNPPASYNEYDPVSNTISPIPGPPVSPPPLAFELSLLALPTGQIMLTGTGTNDFVYTPVGSPVGAARPVIQNITQDADGSYTVTGLQLNGLSQGDSYGDEGNAQTNYPLVRFVSGTTVRYARTFNHSTMGFATGATPVQTHFVLPPDIPSGTYQVSVVANGIASAPTSITVPANELAADISIFSVWQTGYCANVTLTNTRSQAISSWTISFLLQNAHFNAFWNMVPTQTGSTLIARNASFNGTLPPGGQAQLGFCTQSPIPPLGPMVGFARGS